MSNDADQWYLSGPLGIGTDNPSGILTLNGIKPGHGLLSFFSSTADIEYNGGNDGLFIFKDTGGKTAFIGGNIGIGTAEIGANARLNVVGGALAIGSAAQTADAALHITSSFGGFDRLLQMSPTGVSKPGLNLLASHDNSGQEMWWAWGVTVDNRWRINYGTEFKASDGLTITQEGNIGIGTTDVNRTLHVQGHEIHSGGYGAGFSFSNRQTPTFVDQPTTGERWVWYASDGKARLWSGNDKLSITSDGNVDIGLNPLRFSSAWTGSPDAVTNRAEISNDTNVFKTLMIIGNKSAGLGRRVSVWDRLEVNGTLQVSGDINWGNDHSSSGYVRLGNLQICWGSLTIQIYDNTTSQWETQNNIVFPSNFSTIPVVTISLDDPGIGRNVADTVVGSYDVNASGFTVLTKRIPLAFYDPKEGYITVNWLAIGR